MAFKKVENNIKLYEIKTDFHSFCGKMEVTATRFIQNICQIRIHILFQSLLANFKEFKIGLVLTLTFLSGDHMSYRPDQNGIFDN